MGFLFLCVLLTSLLFCFDLDSFFCIAPRSIFRLVSKGGFWILFLAGRLSLVFSFVFSLFSFLFSLGLYGVRFRFRGYKKARTKRDSER